MLEKELLLPCGARLSNRIVKAAMSESLAGPDGHAAEGHATLYRRWAEGGAGLLLTGNVMVDGRFLERLGNIVLEDESGLASLSRMAAAATRDGRHFWAQIGHPGRQTQRFVTSTPVAPSAVGAVPYFGAFGRPRALAEQEILDIIRRFATTAALAKRAGFTGVQIHGAHGYLINQFLSPRTNLRTDRWGGALEGRVRFLIEVIRAVRGAVGPAFPVGLKLNSADFQKGGFSEADSMQVLRLVEAEGIDLLEISGGNYESMALFGLERSQRASTQAREAYFLDYARKARGQTRLPLLVTGGFRTRAAMEEALASGACDAVGLARPLALDPDFPRKLLEDPAAVSGVSPTRMSLKQLEALADVGYYWRQIGRMSRGLEPKPGLNKLGSALAYFWADVAHALLWRLSSSWRRNAARG